MPPFSSPAADTREAFAFFQVARPAWPGVLVFQTFASSSACFLFMADNVTEADVLVQHQALY